MHARIARTAAFAAVILVAAGCTKTLDTSGLESTLQEQVTPALDVGEVSVSCPDNVKVQSGGTFACTATGGGKTFTLTVTQTDDQGTVTWKLADASASSATPSPAA